MGFSLQKPKTMNFLDSSACSSREKKNPYIRYCLLANLLMELAIDSAGKRIQAADWRLNELEEMMGQHEYVNRPKGDPLNGFHCYDTDTEYDKSNIGSRKYEARCKHFGIGVDF
jgi:hypothetical protein